MRNPSTSINRRDWITRSSGALLAAGLWPGRLRAQGNGRGGNFSFLALNDIHFSSPQCPGWMERVTASIQALETRPDFALIVGDLAQDGKQDELGPLKKYLDKLGFPYHVVIGNHDYTPEHDCSVYNTLFPDQINYRFDHKDWQFIGLDTCHGARWNGVAIQPATFAWLKQELAQLDREKPTVLFTHFPMAAGVRMRPTNADELLDLCLDLNLVAVLNGHFHGFTEHQRGETVITTNRCCAISRNNHDGSKEKGYFLCTAKDGDLTRTFVEVTPA